MVMVATRKELLDEAEYQIYHLALHDRTAVVGLIWQLLQRSLPNMADVELRDLIAQVRAMTARERK